MKYTADPRLGAAVSVVLAALGAVLLVVGAGGASGLAWLLLGVGALGLVANLVIYVGTRRKEQGEGSHER